MTKQPCKCCECSLIDTDNHDLNLCEDCHDCDWPYETGILKLQEEN